MVTARLTSHGLGGAVINRRLLLGQCFVGGARVDGPVCAPLAGPQEAVGQDGQQRQDGHRQDHGERDGTCGGGQ